MAGGDVVVGPERRHDALGPLLVLRVAIGVQEVDDHRFAAACEQLLGRRCHLILIERDHHEASGIHAFRHLQAQLARDERLEPSGESIGLRPGAPAELQHVPEPSGGDQTGCRQLAFQQRVGGGGGAVHQQVQGSEIDPGLFQRFQHPERLVVGGGQDLGEMHVARRLIQVEEIGERAPHVHARQAMVHVRTSVALDVGPGSDVAMPAASRVLRAMYRSSDSVVDSMVTRVSRSRPRGHMCADHSDPGLRSGLPARAIVPAR